MSAVRGDQSQVRSFIAEHIEGPTEPQDTINQDELEQFLIQNYPLAAEVLQELPPTIESALTTNNSLLLDRLLDLSNQLIVNIAESYNAIEAQGYDNFNLYNLSELTENDVAQIVEPLTNLTIYVYLLTHLYKQIGVCSSSISDLLIASFDHISFYEHKADLVEQGADFFEEVEKELVKLIQLFDPAINLENIAEYAVRDNNFGDVSALLECYNQIHGAKNKFYFELVDRGFFEDARAEVEQSQQVSDPTSSRLDQALSTQRNLHGQRS